MTELWTISEDGNIITFFEQNYSFDEYGNLVDQEWNAQGDRYAQCILSRIPNIMGWWHSADSFVDENIYPNGEHGIGFYLSELDYGKESSFDGEGNLTFFESNNTDTYQYDIGTDTIIVTHSDGTQTVLNRWKDNTLR